MCWYHVFVFVYIKVDQAKDWICRPKQRAVDVRLDSVSEDLAYELRNAEHLEGASLVRHPESLEGSLRLPLQNEVPDT